jgi:hypothetical protein
MRRSNTGITPDTLGHFCGPCVASSVLGIDRTEAARRILATRKGRARMGYGHTHVAELSRVLGRPWSHAPLDRRGMRPTLAAWLRRNRKAEAILLVSAHFVHVRAGKSIADNGRFPMRGRVCCEIAL